MSSNANKNNIYSTAVECVQEILTRATTIFTDRHDDDDHDHDDRYSNALIAAQIKRKFAELNLPEQLRLELTADLVSPESLIDIENKDLFFMVPIDGEVRNICATSL